MSGASRALVPAVPLIVPIAARWVRQQEKLILRDGTALTKSQLDDAQKVGVSQPGKIRVALVDAIPVPHGYILGPLGRWTGLVSSNTAGITLGFGIYICKRYRGDRGLLVHECVHVGQYERLGGIEAFLREYLRECLDPGYPWGPLEQEAIHRGEEIAG
jgi:hypothetical protein